MSIGGKTRHRSLMQIKLPAGSDGLEGGVWLALGSPLELLTALAMSPLRGQVLVDRKCQNVLHFRSNLVAIRGKADITSKLAKVRL
jgi:hypothetical protein